MKKVASHGCWAAHSIGDVREALTGSFSAKRSFLFRKRMMLDLSKNGLLQMPWKRRTASLILSPQQIDRPTETGIQTHSQEMNFNASSSISVLRKISSTVRSRSRYQDLSDNKDHYRIIDTVQKSCTTVLQEWTLPSSCHPWGIQKIKERKVRHEFHVCDVGIAIPREELQAISRNQRPAMEAVEPAALQCS